MAKREEPKVVGSPEGAQQDAEGAPGVAGLVVSGVDQEQLVKTNRSDAELHEPDRRTAPEGQETMHVPQVRREEEKADKKADARKARFLKLSGVDEDDLLAFNPQSGVGVTSEGGKYQMNAKGTQLRHLAGPVPEALRAEKEQEEEERREREENA